MDPVVTKCKHYFCEHCALKVVALSWSYLCLNYLGVFNMVIMKSFLFWEIEICFRIQALSLCSLKLTYNSMFSIVISQLMMFFEI